MTDYSAPPPAPDWAPTASQSGTETETPPLKDKAADAAQAAKQAGTDVAQTAAEKAKDVAGETTKQARDLAAEARDQLKQQASSQHRSLVGNLRSLGDELGAMSQHTQQSGVATEVVSQARDRVHGVADWLDRREPGDLVDELRSLARRRPGAFLLGAALTGVLAGRLTRGVVAVNTADPSAGSQQVNATPPAAPGQQAWPAAQTWSAPHSWPATEPVPGSQYATASPYAETQAVGYGMAPTDPTVEGYPAQYGAGAAGRSESGSNGPGASGQVWE